LECGSVCCVFQKARSLYTIYNAHIVKKSHVPQFFFIRHEIVLKMEARRFLNVNLNNPELLDERNVQAHNQTRRVGGKVVGLAGKIDMIAQFREIAFVPVIG